MQKEYSKLKSLISKSKNILILTHKAPDFDGFASGLILKKYINTFYPKSSVLFKTRQYPTQKIPFMHELIISQKIDSEKEDLVILVDANSWGICTTKDDTIQITKAKVAVLDHHTTKTMTAAVVVNNLLSSATEQVLDFCMKVKGKKFKITGDISMLGQIGIVFDTGRFAYDNTKPQTYALMSELRKVYELDLEEFEYKSTKFPTETLLPLKIYIQNIHIIKDMAFTYINRSDVDSLKLTKIGLNSAHQFMRDNILRYIQGIHWGFVVKPSFEKEGEWKVSFRSTKGYQEVATVAEAFGGGGHQYASATRVKATDGEQAAKLVIEALNKILEVPLTKDTTSPLPPSQAQTPST